MAPLRFARMTEVWGEVESWVTVEVGVLWDWPRDRVCDLCPPGPGGVQAARKPNSVLDDHSSRRRITGPLEQPTRRFRLPLSLRWLGLFAWAYRASTLRAA